MNIYQKVLAVYAKLRTAINHKADKADFADVFSPTASYEVGMLVVKDDRLYRCTSFHNGAWDGQDFERANVDDVLSAKAQKSDIAPDFSSDAEYSDGQLVYYRGELYRCTATHSGPWDYSHFQTEDANIAAALDNVPVLSDLDYDGMVESLDNTFSVYLKERTFPVVDARSGDISAITLHMPYESLDSSSGESSAFKVADALMRVDTGASECIISTEQDAEFVCSEYGWNVLPANSINILTFTYAGTRGVRNVWLVGVVSQPIEDEESPGSSS